ncbi:MAG: hypothetical protein GY940_14615, partial [bacterium]|nr:hypothetical protein [bacterium]
PLAPDDPDNITDGSGARFRFFKMDDTAWWTDYAGEIERLAEFVTEEKLAVIKLTKPKGKSSHPSGGHVHIGRHLAKPARYAAGDYILFSLRYKAPKGKTINPLAVNRYMDGSGETVTKRFRINKDGQWHRGEVSVRVTRDGVIRPEILWPYARDMVLYLAGWKVEKNAPSKFQGKIKTMGFDARFILSYAAKPFNSRTFSFTSMPRFIILPALLMSFLMFREWKRKEEFEKLILPFILWFYVIIYVFRSGFGRYILPMVPVIMLFFIFFLRDGLRKKKFARNTLAAVTVFTAVGVFFETNYPLVKVLLALFFLAGMWFIYYRQHRPDKSSTHPSAYPSTTVLKEIYITLICVLSFFVFLGTSYSNARQLGRYIAWGHNSQMSEIARLFNPKEPVWINFDRGMIQFYRHDGRYTPFKEGVRSWELKPWVPKATLLKRVARYYTYGFEWEDPGEFREQLHEKSIRKVALLVSTHPGEKYRFPFQERLPQLLKMPFLKRENTITMKNKTLHLFTVKQ